MRVTCKECDLTVGTACQLRALKAVIRRARGDARKLPLVQAARQWQLTPLADIRFRADYAAMKRIGFLAYGASLAGITLITAGYAINSILFLYDYAGGFRAFAVTGWLIATFGPLTLSLLAWIMSGRIKARWLPHIVFIPVAMAVFGVGSSLLFDTIGALGDSMADGFALLTGIGYLMLALLVHLAATIALGVTNIRRWSNGS